MSAAPDAAPAGQPATKRPPMLVVDGLTRRFGGLAALEDVSFDVTLPEDIFSLSRLERGR